MADTTNLNMEKGVLKLKELIEQIDICLFCTNLKIDDGASCRPMSSQEVDSEGNIWFFSGHDSEKNEEIKNDKNVRLFYSHPGKSSYLVLNGTAEIINDREKIKTLWSPVLKAWFPEGEEDPNLSLLKVKPESAYYWDVEGNKMINFFKMIASAVTGHQMLDAKEGNITV